MTVEDFTNKLYHYKAFVPKDKSKIYDGDTLKIDFKLGFNVEVKNEKCRMCRIDTPEINKKDQKESAIKSRDRLRELILGKNFFVQTIKDKRGKFGRVLVEIWLEKDGKMININDLMVTEGLAIYKDY